MSRFIHPLHVGLAGWLNRQHRRTGPVFMDRYTSVGCEAERAALLIAYQHNNPVRAGLVADPADCDWTSHRAYLGLVPAPPWLAVEAGLALCGFDSSPAGRLAFHGFVLSRVGVPRDPVLSGDDLAATVRGVRREVGAPVELTDAVVGAVVEAQRQVVVHPDGVVRPRWPGSALQVARRVSTQAGVGLEVLRTRARAVVAARRLALWLWARELNRGQSEMNGVLGLSSGRGSRMLQRISTAERRRARELAGELWGAMESASEGAKGR